MEKRPPLPKKKKDVEGKKKNVPLLIIGIVSLIFDILLALLFFFWRYNSTHFLYQEISRMTITDTTLPEGYETTGEVHYSEGTDGYVQFTALNQRLDTPSFGAHPSYYVAFDVTALIYFSDEAYNPTVSTFMVTGYDSASQPIETVRVSSFALNDLIYMHFTTPDIDHFIFSHSGPACALDGTTQALAGIGHIVVLVPREISL